MGGDVGEVLRDVGLAEEEGEKKDKEASVYLHCNVGGPLSPSGSKETAPTPAEAESSAPRRRGFDTLLDSGLSPEDVANMRRQFYESRGEEVPDLGGEDMNDEHARALEEQWIEGDLTAATATSKSHHPHFLIRSVIRGHVLVYPARSPDRVHGTTHTMVLLP